MANVEDTSNAIVEKKPVLKEATEVVNGQYISPNWESLRQNKGVAKKKLVRCQGAGNCTLPAIVRPNFIDKGPKNLCQTHWDKVKGDVESYEPGPMYITRDLDLAADIRGEDAVATKQGKSRINQSIYDITGTYVHMQGPGRPVKTETERANIPETLNELTGQTAIEAPKVIDHVTPVINRALTGGGHYPVDHPQKLELASKALAHAIWEGGGEPDKDTFHRKAAELGMTDEAERNRYFMHALAKNIKERGVARAVPGKDPITELTKEVQSNPTTITPNAFDDYSDLMGSDAPSARDVGLKKGQAPSTD